MTPDLAAATEREVETRRDRRCRRPDVERTADRRRKPPRAIRTRHAVHGRRVHASSLVASEVQGCQINRSGTATLNQFHCQRDQWTGEASTGGHRASVTRTGGRFRCAPASCARVSWATKP